MPAGKDKSEFWWASIAGAQPEPVEVTMLDGKRVAYTCGCGDPFFLDDADCPVRLGAARAVPGHSDDLRIAFRIQEPIARPSLPKRAEIDAMRMYYEPQRQQHSWRGPR